MKNSLDARFYVKIVVLVRPCICKGSENIIKKLYLWTNHKFFFIYLSTSKRLTGIDDLPLENSNSTDSKTLATGRAICTMKRMRNNNSSNNGELHKHSVTQHLHVIGINYKDVKFGWDWSEQHIIRKMLRYTFFA